MIHHGITIKMNTTIMVISDQWCRRQQEGGPIQVNSPCQQIIMVASLRKIIRHPHPVPSLGLSRNDCCRRNKIEIQIFSVWSVLLAIGLSILRLFRNNAVSFFCLKIWKLYLWILYSYVGFELEKKENFQTLHSSLFTTSGCVITPWFSTKLNTVYPS